MMNNSVVLRPMKNGTESAQIAKHRERMRGKKMLTVRQEKQKKGDLRLRRNDDGRGRKKKPEIKKDVSVRRKSERSVKRSDKRKKKNKRHIIELKKKSTGRSVRSGKRAVSVAIVKN